MDCDEIRKRGLYGYVRRQRLYDCKCDRWKRRPVRLRRNNGSDSERAIINLKFNSAAQEKEALVYDIYGAATIENVLVEVTDISAVPADQNIFFLTPAIRTLNNNTERATLRNVVFVMRVERAAASSKTTVSVANARNVSGNSMIAENVHVISNYKLYNNSDTVANVTGSTPANIGGGITRYGTGATYATFADRFTNEETAIADAGLSADYWEYDAVKGYPVFKAKS